jgi:hypothetical protein
MDGDGWREVSTSKVDIDDKVAKDSRIRQEFGSGVVTTGVWCLALA